MQPVRVAAAAIDAGVGTADLARNCLDGPAAREGAATGAPKLVAKFRDKVDHNVVVDVFRARYHAERETAHQFVTLVLAILPGEELVDGPGLLGSFRYPAASMGPSPIA